MRHEWKQLMDLCGNKDFVIERVHLIESGIKLEGAFELPALAKLAFEDAIFIVAFIKAEGSIKEMEKLFGVSYPTIKAKLGRLKEKLASVETDIEMGEDFPSSTSHSDSTMNPNKNGGLHTTETKKDILKLLRDGKIDSKEAIRRINKL